MSLKSLCQGCNHFEVWGLKFACVGSILCRWSMRESPVAKSVSPTNTESQKIAIEKMLHTLSLNRFKYPSFGQTHVWSRIVDPITFP